MISRNIKIKRIKKTNILLKIHCLQSYARHFSEYAMLRPVPLASISPFSFSPFNKRFTVGFGIASFVAMSLDFMPE